MSDELLETVWRNLFFFLWLCFLMTAGVYAIGPNLGVAGGGGALEKIEIELRAFRLQQFEAYGKTYGSKAWKILYEAVGISESALRKCMILIWRDLIGLDMDAKFSAVVGAVLVVIPKNLNSLTGSDREAFLAIEQQLASLHTDLTIYFARESAELQSLLASVALTSGRATTAMQQLLNSMIADNYQISSTNTATTNVATAKVYNIIAQLNAAERGKPYLFIVAHYDTYGIIPAMATGADSNGSGMAVLLELLAIFSQLYAQSQRAHYNLVFALTAGGQFNYQGSRSFIDDFNERYSEETVSLAICLDGLAKGDHLYVHAAKMPSIGSSASNFFEILNDFGTGANGSRPQIEMITKKINLAADRMAWEHEIYNIRRIHALTLSHFKNYSDPERNTLLDTVNSLSMATLETNAKTIADAMISFVFNINSQHCKNALDGTKAECTVLNEAINVDRQRLGAWMNMFATKPRPIVVPQQQLIANLHEVAKRYAHSVQIAEVSVNDFVLYNVIEDTLTANIVKPSIFELLLASTICAYLYAIYYFAMNAQCLLECSLTKIRKLLKISKLVFIIFCLLSHFIVYVESVPETTPAPTFPWPYSQVTQPQPQSHINYIIPVMPAMETTLSEFDKRLRSVQRRQNSLTKEMRSEFKNIGEKIDKIDDKLISTVTTFFGIFGIGGTFALAGVAIVISLVLGLYAIHIAKKSERPTDDTTLHQAAGQDATARPQAQAAIVAEGLEGTPLVRLPQPQL